MRKNNSHYVLKKDLRPILTIVFLIMTFCVIGILSGRSYAETSQELLINDVIEETDNTPETDQASTTTEKWQTVRMRVTAYCPCPKCCGKSADGITACGHRVYDNNRFAAADKKYSFGTKLIIPGYNNSKSIEVLDRGGAIRGNRLDVFFNSHQEALKWGVKYLDVKVLCE